MNRTDKQWWQVFRDNLRGTVANDEYTKICELHAYYFSHNLNLPCKCNPKIIQSYIDDLNDLYAI